MGTPSPATPWGGALWALLLATFGYSAGQPLGGESMCTAQPLAKYSITFTGKWSQASFPKQYPMFRPPAQWSSLLGECSPCRPVPGRPGGDPHCSGGYGHLTVAPRFTAWRGPHPIHFSAGGTG